MAHEPYTRTNQKLYFAGLALESWRVASQLTTLNAQGRIQAEREAALFHLHGALLALCQEIAGYYRMPHADAVQVEMFLDDQCLADWPSPELSELADLARQPGSWLAGLRHAHGLLLRPPRESGKVRRDSNPSLIIAIGVVTDEPPLSPGILEAWRAELKTLILRFRENLSES